MSVSDESKSGAKDAPLEDAETASGPTIEHDAPAPAKPSPIIRTLKLYGILLGINVVALLVAAGTYPYWRADAVPFVARIGLDLEALEQRLNVPRWAITHGRAELEAKLEATATAAPADDVTQSAAPSAPVNAPVSPPVSAPVSAPAAPVSAPEPAASPLAEVVHEEMEALTERLQEVQERVGRMEARLDALENTAPVSGFAPAAVTAATADATSALTEQLETLAARLAELEANQDSLENVQPAATSVAENSALLGTVVALAERVAAMEGRGSAGAAEVTALREATQAMAGRLSGLDDEVRKVGAALAEETPAHDRATLLLVSVGQLAVATSGAAAFEAELATVRSVAGDQEDLAGPLNRLAPHAETGAPTFAALRSAFPTVSDAVVRGRDVGAPDGVLGQTLSRVAALVTVRKVDGVGIETVDGALAAAEAALGDGDLAAAVAALGNLTEAPAAAASGWVARAKARLAVDAAVSDLQTAAIRALAAAG